MSSAVKSTTKGTYGGTRVDNFMGGGSFKLNPIETLKMVTASSIFGEPAYYRNGAFASKTSERVIGEQRYSTHQLVKDETILSSEFEGKTTSDIMENVIDEALDYDFNATLDWASTLRSTEYNMRLNPQVVMVRAAAHPKRKEFTALYPGKFNDINDKVMSRLDEPSTQFTYWLYKNKDKNKIPTILKKTWAKKYENASRYGLAKYKNAGLGMIDTIRVCHASGKKNTIIDELMKTGTIKFEEGNETWETLKSQGKSWKEILETINIPHMALLRNLRGIFTEVNDATIRDMVLDNLKKGVAKGRQFPFRYYTAKQVIESTSNINFRPQILDALEECIDISMDNLPKLKGKTMCLSDNSGSAWGSFNSEYGSVTVADIANLSSVITAKNSDEGYVGTFGDDLQVTPIVKRNGVLAQHEKVTKVGKNVGRATENGLWLFFKKAIDNKEQWDNVFIYSDQQAGHGGLYGTAAGKAQYQANYGYGSYIDLIKVINEYRRTVNPKVNIFTIQVAGYDNVVVPENLYRTSVLYGWSGKEVAYADAINKQWDEIDAQKAQKSQVQ
jgi:polyhydroxyalkanoate synthesis regulator phasin